jgi:hypothetical protein
LLGTTATPSAVVASAISDTSFAPSATLVPLTKYYWQIVAHDPYGGSSTGPIWAFTTGALPISAFTGAYNADEPAESYSYGVNFSLVDATTIKCDNYWNSGWVVNFTLDLTKLTYSFPTITFGAYSMIESGIIDPANGKMVGSYTIWNNGTVIEQGVHTYAKL